MKKGIVNVKKIIGIVLIVVIVMIGLLFSNSLFNNETNTTSDGFVASDQEKIKLLDLEFKEAIEIVRGKQITVYKKEVINEKDNQKYKKIKYENKEYLINPNNVTDDKNKIVLEQKRFIRTPVTLYKDSIDSAIMSMIKKGSEVEVIGYDKVDNNGYVNKYKVNYQNQIGYIYAKYTTDNKESALLNYDADKTYKIHDKREAGNLDFYPYTKANFEDNVMPKEVRSLYINSGSISLVDKYIELAKQSNINAFVVDIKDNTSPAYASLVMKKYSPTNYKKAHNSMENYQKYIKKLKDNGFYVIGRITVFKDSYYVTDHPESAIGDKKTGKPFLHNGSYWPTAFNRGVWEFNVELAKEAVKEMGFNEIQFDYIRFPDRTYNLEKDGLIDMKNAYEEEKAQAIQGFLMYACDEIHQMGAYVSADVFGEAAHTYVTGYGQYWGAISNIVDVISAMPYPDHFNAYEYGFDKVVWTVPYELLKFWGSKYAAIRQTEIPTPAKVRTWIQTYDTIRSPYIEYDSNKVSDQIKALYESGLNDGYMTWNSSSSLNKYKSVMNAFKKNYKGV